MADKEVVFPVSYEVTTGNETIVVEKEVARKRAPTLEAYVKKSTKKN